MSRRVRSGGEDLLDPGLLQLGDVVRGDDAAGHDHDIVGPAGAELLHDLGEQGHVRAGVAGEPDGVRVLLDRGLGDLLGRLEEAGVDHLEAGVAKRPGDDLGAAIVPVETRLRDDHPQLLGHGDESIDDPPVGLPGGDRSGRG